MTSQPEFSRIVDRRSITAQPVVLEADEAERTALARRFDIVAVDALRAVLSLEAQGEQVHATGELLADVVQGCAVSGEDLPVKLREKLDLLFVPEHALAPPVPDEEVELDEGELDEIPYAGTQFDLGEAVAQSLALAIDPYLTGPQAESARKTHGLLEEGAAGPLAEALRALKRD